MTDLFTERTPVHAEPEQPIYPITYSGWPPCATCFRQRHDLVHVADPHGPGLIHACDACARAIAAGRPVDLPTGDELADVWCVLARLHQNREITDDTIDAAITTLAPGRPLYIGRRMLLDLQDALLRLQAAEDPDTVLDTEVMGPDFDPETFLNHCRGLVDDARAWITRGAH